MLELLSARIALSYTPCIHHTWHSGGVLQPLDRALSRGGGTQSVLGVWAVCVPMLFILCLQSDCPPCLHKPCGHGGTMEGRQALGGHTHERVQWTFSQHSTHASSCGVWDGSFCSSDHVDAPSARLCYQTRTGSRDMLSCMHGGHVWCRSDMWERGHVHRQFSTTAVSWVVCDGSFCSSDRVDAPSARLCYQTRTGVRVLAGCMREELVWHGGMREAKWGEGLHSSTAASCGVWDGSFCSSCRVDAPSAQLCCLIRLGCRAVLDNVWQDGLELSPSVLLELEGLENELPAEQKTFLVWTLSGRLAGTCSRQGWTSLGKAADGFTDTATVPARVLPRVIPRHKEGLVYTRALVLEVVVDVRGMIYPHTVQVRRNLVVSSSTTYDCV